MAIQKYRDNQIQSTGVDQWQMMREQATELVTTGYLPDSIKTAAQAVAIILTGRELGIDTMHSLRSISVIKGKPTAGAELMLALIYRDHGSDAVMFDETNNTICTISYKRNGWTSRKEFSFTIEDAQTAQLAGDNWKKYPAAMLRARCISAMARLAFPDTIAGMYTPEELGATVRVTDNDEIEIVNAEKGPAQSTNGNAKHDADEEEAVDLIEEIREIVLETGFTKENTFPMWLKERFGKTKLSQFTKTELAAVVDALKAPKEESSNV